MYKKNSTPLDFRLHLIEVSEFQRAPRLLLRSSG